MLFSVRLLFENFPLEKAFSVNESFSVFSDYSKKRSDRDRYATPFLIQLLLSQTELFNDSSVSFDVYLLEVVEKVSSVTYHLEEAATAVVVLVVVLEVLGEVSYSVSKDSDLNLGRTCVALVGSVLLNNCLLFCCCHFRIHLSKIKYFCFTDRTATERVKFTLLVVSRGSFTGATYYSRSRAAVIQRTL